MKTLGVNLSHDTSLAVYDGEKVLQYFEEDRFKRIKYWDVLRKDPHTISIDSLKQISHKIDQVGCSTFICHPHISTIEVIEDAKVILARIVDDFKVERNFFDETLHHVYHAMSGFYFSKFDEASCIIVDGAGAPVKIPDDHPDKDPSGVTYNETESIYYVNRADRVVDCQFKRVMAQKFYWVDIVHRKFGRQLERLRNDQILSVSNDIEPGCMFSLIAILNFGHALNAGQVMGIAPYALNYPGLEDRAKLIRLSQRAQAFLLDTTTALIEKAVKLNRTKNIVLSGGCALNCVNNYKLLKRFPDLNIFVDPCANDGGTAIGIAIYFHDYHK